MKYITLIIGLLVVGCGTIPVKELTAEEKKVVGEYQALHYTGNTIKYVFLANGTGEWFLDGKKEQGYKWAIVNGEIHVVNAHAGFDRIDVYSINPDGSMTIIAGILKDGKLRVDSGKREELTFKKIK